MKSTISHTFVITLSQKSVWTDYVSKSLRYDFYHTWDYQDLAKDGDPVLFVTEKDNNFIAIPLLKRAIPNTNYYDFHSVYGYTGPISNKEINNLDLHLILDFQEGLRDYLRAERAISVFVKFHPFFDQTKALENLGGLYDNGKTIAIDLTQTLVEQRKKYRTSTYKDIMKAKKRGFIIHEIHPQKYINAFTNLYHQNMQRIGAASSYMFDEAYFTTLLHSQQCNARLLSVFYQDKMICSSVVTFTKGIAQAHLIATDFEYLKYSPSKFLVDEICQVARRYGVQYFHLGGGLSYKENSLLDWKLGFSDYIIPHKSWRYVVDQNAYNQLVLQSGNDINDTIDFFPLYRLVRHVV